MVFEYNYFFYANTCHVCKKFGKEVSLKRCGNCTMIAYCSKEHQKKHWSQHKDLCVAVYNVLRDNKMSSFLSNKQDLCTEKWARMKMNFMLLVAMKIPRKLEYYEEQMFKFFRSCAVCYNWNAKELVDCHNCPNTSFCIKHKNDTVHKNLCYLLKLCFKLDMVSILHERKIPEIKSLYHTKHVNLPQDMKYFIEDYIKTRNDLHLSMEEETMINAEYLTRPLTFLYAGSILINLCKNCLYSSKQLVIQMQDMLYENYVDSDSYIKPNFIIGYNVGIHECENFESENYTWTRSLQMITKQNCPLILTSYTLPEAEKEQIRLETILDRDVKCTYFEQNPYSSLRPYRDFETGEVYYQNQYIIIYQNFGA
ncbi:uncharacterized protein LOC143145941 [Ptiloglossa arizonensis]|uniref:uncharacterized protein LOC143145941 n=1 Tax=Ptiloglossa arizonensis TaxID=3350558 RepID=UPI003FA116F3